MIPVRINMKLIVLLFLTVWYANANQKSPAKQKQFITKLKETGSCVSVPFNLTSFRVVANLGNGVTRLLLSCHLEYSPRELTSI
jgi:hypothetical protein